MGSMLQSQTTMFAYRVYATEPDHYVLPRNSRFFVWGPRAGIMYRITFVDQNFPFPGSLSLGSLSLGSLSLGSLSLWIRISRLTRRA